MWAWGDLTKRELPGGSRSQPRVLGTCQDASGSLEVSVPVTSVISLQHLQLLYILTQQTPFVATRRAVCKPLPHGGVPHSRLPPWGPNFSLCSQLRHSRGSRAALHWGDNSRETPSACEVFAFKGCWKDAELQVLHAVMYVSGQFQILA